MFRGQLIADSLVLSWPQVKRLALSAAPGVPVGPPSSESGKAYGTADALELLKAVGRNEFNSSKATVVEIDHAAKQLKCTDIFVTRVTRDGVEIDTVGESISSRLPRKGWTIVAACIGHHTEQVRNAARH